MLRAFGSDGRAKSEMDERVCVCGGGDSLEEAEGRVAFDVVLLLEAVKLSRVDVHSRQHLRRETNAKNQTGCRGAESDRKASNAITWKKNLSRSNYRSASCKKAALCTVVSTLCKSAAVLKNNKRSLDILNDTSEKSTRIPEALQQCSLS